MALFDASAGSNSMCHVLAEYKDVASPQ